MYDKAVECIAYAHPARFGIENYIFTFFSIAMDVEISVAYACAGFYDRYPGIVADVFYKTFSAAWYQKVNISDGIQQFGSRLPVGRKQCNGIFVCTVIFEYFFYYGNDSIVGMPCIVPTFEYTGI